MLTDFSFDMNAFGIDLLRLTIALLLGSVVGIERQLAGQSAGLRTHILVSVGAAIFTLAGIVAAGTEQQDLTRVVQGIAAGVGFLGAGTILKLNGGDKKVQGLTTASSIWIAAAMGTAAGLGEYALAAAAACISLITLCILRPVSLRLSKLSCNKK